MKKQRFTRMADILAGGILCILALFVLSPIALIGCFSFSDGLQSYTELCIWNPDYIHAMIQSMKIAFTAACGTLIVSIPAAYVFAKISFRGREKIFFIYIIIMIMPFSVTMLPQYMVARRLGIYDSLLALILPGIFNPFATFLLTQIMKSFPNMCIEAASLETNSTIYVLYHIVLPSMKSGIVCAWSLSFVELWNMVAEPSILLETPDTFPLSMWIKTIEAVDINSFAAAMLYILLPICIFSFFSSEILEGLGEYRLK